MPDHALGGPAPEFHFRDQLRAYKPDAPGVFSCKWGASFREVSNRFRPRVSASGAGPDAPNSEWCEQGRKPRSRIPCIRTALRRAYRL